MGMLESMYKVHGGMSSGVSGREMGYVDMVRKKFDSIRVAVAASFSDVNSVASVVLHCWANIPALIAVLCPSASVFGLDVEDDFGSGWCKGRTIEVENSVELSVGGKLRIEARLAQHVEGHVGLLDELIPKVHGEVGVEQAETCDEVIFPGTNGTFSGVAAMDARRGQLEVDAGGDQVAFQGVAGFVVKDVKFGAEAATD